VSPSAAWTAEIDQSEASFGQSVGTAGDVNGDGCDDVIVGAHRFDNPRSYEGGAWVYYGSAAGVSLSPAWSAEGDQDSAFFGYSVSTAGDVNGDGYDDIIVGAYGYDRFETNAGAAFLFLGSPAGLSPVPAWEAYGTQGERRFGFSVSTAGDVNGDGYDDVIVGDYLYDHNYDGEGAAYVYHGSPSGLGSLPVWATYGQQENAQYGFSVGTAGDVNGDGYDDVIVGANEYGAGSPGAAFVYFGSDSGLGYSVAWMASSNQDTSDYGFAVGTAGDVNGDGYDDVVVGAPEFENGESREGKGFVYLGFSGGVVVTPTWEIEGNLADAFFGYAVGAAGDVNHDGFDDIIIGAYRFTNDLNDEGAAFVYLGSAGGLETSPIWTAEGDQSSAEMGASVNGAGDVNGDLHADVIVGAPGFGNVENNEGRAFVFHGFAPIEGLVATNDSPTPLGSSTTLTGTVTGGSELLFEWDFGDGQTGVGSVVTHTYPAAGVFTAVVTASNTVSEMVASTIVAVDEPIVGLVAVDDSPAPAGYLSTLTATVEAGTNVTYEWDFGDGYVGSGSHVGHVYSEPGDYLATVTARNSVSELSIGISVAIGLGVVVDEDISGTIVYSDAQELPTTLDIPTAAVTTTTSLFYHPLPNLTIPISPNLRFANHAFDIQAYRRGEQMLGLLFNRPLTLTITYSDADVVGIAEDQLRVYYFDGEMWVDPTSHCGPSSTYDRNLPDNVLSLSICQLGQWGMLRSISPDGQWGMLGQWGMMGPADSVVYLPAVLCGAP
jgi:hypothetical protein